MQKYFSDFKDFYNLIVNDLFVSCAFFADTFDDIFCFFGLKAAGQWHLRNLYVGQADGLVAETAGEVYMAGALAGVVVVAYTVFLRSATVVDIVQQMGVAEEGEGAEQGGAVDGGQRLLKVGKAEYTVDAVAQLLPYKQAYGGDPYACLLQYLFVVAGVVHGLRF